MIGEEEKYLPLKKYCYSRTQLIIFLRYKTFCQNLAISRIQFFHVSSSRCYLKPLHSLVKG